jgi:hypothetical protein
MAGMTEGKSWWRAIGVVILIGLLLRGALLCRSLARGALDDPDNYLAIARALVEGSGFAIDGRPTAYRPPLYPLLLAPFAGALGARADWGVAALHLVLSAGTIVLTALAARAWWHSPPVGLFAAAVVACDPVLVAQARSVMTETLAAFLFAAVLAALITPGKWGIGLGGLFLGLSALCRPSAWPVVWVVALASVVARPGSSRERLGRGCSLLVIPLVVAAPWALRNALVFGEPVWTTTHGGYTLFLANNPVYYDEVVRGPAGAVWSGDNQWLWWDSVNRSTRGMTEPQADRALLAQAVRVIATRPGDFSLATVARLGRFWGLAPAAAVYSGPLRLLAALWTAPLWAAFLAGLVRRETWDWPRVSAPAVVIGLCLVHSVYWTDQRMRAPIVPAVAVVAAGCLARFKNFSHDSAGRGGVRATPSKKIGNSYGFCCSNPGETLVL